MSTKNEVCASHLAGERELAVVSGPEGADVVDTYGGKIQVKWDEDATVTPYGQMMFFVEFLKAAGLWEAWVEQCPVNYKSTNAPSKADVLGTILLSVLAGHRRYCHVTALRWGESATIGYEQSVQ